MKQLLLFSTPYCVPCKAFKPHFHELKRKRLDVSFEVVDATQKPELAQKYKVRSVPTLIYLEDDVWLGQKIHPTDEEDILELIG